MTSYFQPRMSEADTVRAIQESESERPIDRVWQWLSRDNGLSVEGPEALQIPEPEQGYGSFETVLRGPEWSYDPDRGGWLKGLPEPYFSDTTAPVVEQQFEPPVYDPSQPLAVRPTESAITTTTPGMAVSDVLEARKEAYDTEIAKSLKGEKSALDNRFGDVIAKLKTDLHDFQLGKTGIDQAYNSYQAAAGTIMKQAIIDAPDLAPTDVVADVGRSYDMAEGALNDALLAIDTSGSPGMAGAMNAELRFWENSITKALTADIEMGDLLHTTASDYAKALAQAAYSDDQYRAEEERTKIQIELNGAIQDKQEELARQNAMWAREQQRIEESFDEFGEGWSPEDYDEFKDSVFNEAARDWLMSMGLTEEQAREGMAWFENARAGANDPNIDQGKISSNQEWRAWTQELVNDDALGRIRIGTRSGSDAYDLAMELRLQGINDIELDENGNSTGIRATQQRDEYEMMRVGKKNLNFADWDEPTIAVMSMAYGWGDPKSPAVYAGLDPFDENTASLSDDFYGPVSRLWEFQVSFSEDIDRKFKYLR